MMSLSIPISDLAAAIDRPESLIRIAAKSREVSIENGALSLAEAAIIIRIFAGNYTDETEEIERLQGEIASLRAREQDLTQARDLALKDNGHLGDALAEARSARRKAEARSERFEAMLADVSKSLAHLVDQRDRIVGKHLNRSRTIEQWQGDRKVLLLCDPVNRILA